MERLPAETKEILWLLVIAATMIGAILSTVFSLIHGISVVFPFLYILPIILMVYIYPKRAVLFTVALGLVYISLVCLLGGSDPSLIVISTAWFAIFILIAVVASAYATGLLDKKARIRYILDSAKNGFICFDRSSGQIREVNALCAQWLGYEKQELEGKDLSLVWNDDAQRTAFLHTITCDNRNGEIEAVFSARDRTPVRLTLSAALVTDDSVFCSAIGAGPGLLPDGGHRRQRPDLEQQVRVRTAHLERINEDLRREVRQRRKAEETLLADAVLHDDGDEA